jgi:phage baseplate assembly protein W
MPAFRQSRSFKDISLSFRRHPVTNDVITISNEDAIKRSVRNLVETINNERPFNSLIGSEVRSSLFEPADRDILTRLEIEIETAIKNFEPRVTLTRVLADHPPDTNEITVQVEYDIIGQESQPQELTFILQPTRV